MSEATVAEPQEPLIGSTDMNSHGGAAAELLAEAAWLVQYLRTERLITMRLIGSSRLIVNMAEWMTEAERQYVARLAPTIAANATALKVPRINKDEWEVEKNMLDGYFPEKK